MTVCNVILNTEFNNIEEFFENGNAFFLFIKNPAILIVDGENITAEKNTFFLVDKSIVLTSSESESDNFYDLICLSLSDDDANNLSNMDIRLNEKISLYQTDEIQFYIGLIYKEFISESVYSKNIANSLADILFCKVSENLVRWSEPCCESQNNTISISEIRRRIYAEPYQKHNVDDGAFQTGMSRSGFQHLYKKIFGVSFVEDVINSRISLAKDYLESTDLSVKEISEKCGYKTFAHFDRQFKKKTDVSPLEYREKSKNN